MRDSCFIKLCTSLFLLSDRFCGEELKDKTVFSVGRNLVVVIVGNLKSKRPLEGKGLKASVKFIREGEEERNNSNYKLLLKRETSAQNK